MKMELSAYDLRVLHWIFDQARDMQGAYIGREHENGIRKIDRLAAKIFEEGIEEDSEMEVL